MPFPSTDQASAIVPSSAGFHVMAKPSGPACNIDCAYCFYLEKEALFPGKKMRRMSDDVLEAYVRNTIASNPPDQPVMFTWQGGEPTLLGIDFYRRAVALQQRYGRGRRIDNSFQTNGTLIDEDWAAFLAENRFLVGLSLDGPREIHNRFRRYRSGAPTFDFVMQALERLQRHGVEYNVLACVDRHSGEHPLQVYRFLKRHGVKFIQFTPVVERLAGPREKARGLDLSGPGGAEDGNTDASLAPFSVRPADWGRFLSVVFREWAQQDVGEVFVMNFEWTLAALMDAPGAVCVHQPTCGRAIVAEHDGTVYGGDDEFKPAAGIRQAQGGAAAGSVPRLPLAKIRRGRRPQAPLRRHRQRPARAELSVRRLRPLLRHRHAGNGTHRHAPARRPRRARGDGGAAFELASWIA